MIIKAIETVYKGYKFRSRLEARWAVFFDALGIKWQYELEGFDLGGTWYLPDFWLLDYHKWVEIKPTEQHLDSDTQAKFWKFANNIGRIDDLGNWVGSCMLVGEPYLNEYKVFRSHPSNEGQLSTFLNEAWIHCPLCHNISLSHYNLDYGRYEGFTTASVYCWNCDSVDRNWKETADTWFYKGDVETKLKSYITESPKLMMAYNAARQARFEHGQNGH